MAATCGCAAPLAPPALAGRSRCCRAPKPQPPRLPRAPAPRDHIWPRRLNSNSTDIQQATEVGPGLRTNSPDIPGSVVKLSDSLVRVGDGPRGLGCLGEVHGAEVCGLRLPQLRAPDDERGSHLALRDARESRGMPACVPPPRPRPHRQRRGRIDPCWRNRRRRAQQPDRLLGSPTGRRLQAPRPARAHPADPLNPKHLRRVDGWPPGEALEAG